MIGDKSGDTALQISSHETTPAQRARLNAAASDYQARLDQALSASLAAAPAAAAAPDRDTSPARVAPGAAAASVELTDASRWTAARRTAAPRRDKPAAAAALASRFSGAVDSMSDETKRCGVCLCFTTLFFVFFVIIPLSFSRIHYYEYGFTQSRISGTVDRSKVYGPGNHFLNPDATFVKYPRDAQNLDLKGLSAWTKADDASTITAAGAAGAGAADGTGDGGTSVTIDVSLQYVLVEDRLSALYEKVGLNFEGLMKNLVINEVKNAAKQYSMQQYLRDTSTVEGGFQAKIQAAISDPLKTGGAARVLQFQLRKISFPPSVVLRKLAAAIQDERNAADSFRKKAAVTREETVTAVKLKTNNARYTREEAAADAKQMVRESESTALQKVQDARTEGLKLLRDKLEITGQKHLLSLDYLFTMLDSNATVFVDFDGVLKSVN